MKYLAFLFFIGLCIACTQGKKETKGETAWQKKMNANFKDATKSPLKPRDLKNFEGLDFYTFDSVYVVKAHLEHTPNSEWFNMKTTTSRLTEERVYGILNFILKGKTHQLNIFQGKELMTTEGYEDYLFLPFLDDTNGEGSYSGGRYLDLRIPEGDTLIIDFNKANNPYCVYDDKFSCPLVPRANYLNVKVEAGLKAFKTY